MRIFATIAWLAAIANAATLNVGSGKTYTTITAAYNAAVAGDTIYVYPGTYNEQLVITKASITLKGSTYPSTNPAGNTAIMTHALYASAAGSNDASATLLVKGANFKMYNMNIVNTAGTASQAVALSITGFYAGIYACTLTGWQDTLYTHSGSQFFSRCYIVGATDFIFGITGNAWFQGCTLGVLRVGGWITAQGRTSASTAGYYVFEKAKVVVASGAASGTAGSFFLGRPWGDYARVVFQNSNLNNIIAAAGWQVWTSTQVTTNILFAEYANTNGAGTRVSFAKKNTASVAIATILPSPTWIDSAYLGLAAV